MSQPMTLQALEDRSPSASPLAIGAMVGVLGLGIADLEVRIVGEPSSDPKNRLMKAERIYIGKREYNLYPNRD